MRYTLTFVAAFALLGCSSKASPANAGANSALERPTDLARAPASGHLPDELRPPR